MKIQNQYKVAQNNSVTKESKKKDAGSSLGLSSSSLQEEVQLSESASFVQNLRATAEKMDPEEVRGEVVEQAKSDIRDGKLGSQQDYEQTINALLMEADED